MNTRSVLRAFAVIAVTFLPASAADAASPSVIVVDEDDQATDDAPTLAWFEGRQIDLKKSWGRATACAVTVEEIRCFRNEAQMDKYLGDAGVAMPDEITQAVTSFAASAFACSSAVRLYDGTSYTGSVLSIATQGTYMNLVNYGWDNRTSSYRIGACDATFYSGAWGSGTAFGATWAWAQVAYMGGWDNALSSLLIY